MSSQPFPSQKVMNQFVLVMFHMQPGNVLSKKAHLLRLQDILERIADDETVEYVTIIPIRPGKNAKDIVLLPPPL